MYAEFFPHIASVSSRQCAAELYNAIYRYVLERQDIAELSIEDPAEAFEDLRDKCDLKMLLANEQFMSEVTAPPVTAPGKVAPTPSKGGGKTGAKKPRRSGTLGPPTNHVWAEEWRLRLKLATVRLLRCTELVTGESHATCLMAT